VLVFSRHEITFFTKKKVEIMVCLWFVYGLFMVCLWFVWYLKRLGFTNHSQTHKPWTIDSESVVFIPQARLSSGPNEEKEVHKGPEFPETTGGHMKP
jgi:hypothetical protein